MKKRVLFSVLLCCLAVCLLAGAAFAGMENFQKTQSYKAGQFTDVKSSDWFAAGVQSAFELGLMKGSSANTFKPTGNLTVAEALTIACRLHSIYAANGATFAQSNPWYQTYVDYALKNKIMKEGLLDPKNTITREQFAYLMCGGIPEADLNAINTITAIPDEVEKSTFGGFVYRLYRAGVLTGSDKYGTFKPTTAIQRSEVATIATRMAEKTQRKTFKLEARPAVKEIQLAGATQLKPGESTTWTAKTLPEGSASKITWVAGNPGVATVDQNGKITGKKAGQCNITASAANGVKKTVLLTVEKAAEIKSSGTYGQGLKWTLDDAGNLTISGTGDLPKESPWSYSGVVKSVVFNEGVKRISDVFRFDKTLTSVFIPGSASNVEDAFGFCGSLTKIDVSENNPKYASQDGVLFNKDKTYLICCPGGKSGAYVIPDSVTSIKDGAFFWCEKLTSITIPDSVRKFGKQAFGNCTGLTSITIPGGASFPRCIFDGCTGLKSIGVSGKTGRYVSRDGVLFEEKTKLKEDGSTVSGSGIEGDLLFRFPEGKSGAYVIPDGVTSIYNLAFSGCKGLTSITIPDSVTNIGVLAFDGCDSLTYNEYDNALYLGNSVHPYLVLVKAKNSAIKSCTIPSGTRIICGRAFMDCSSLTNVTIPDSVTSIGTFVFYGCKSLMRIDVSENNSYFTSQDGVLFKKDKTKLLRFPEGKSGAYAVPDDVTKIEDSAFSQCSKLTSVTIPGVVETIGESVFSNCTGLTSVTILEGVRTIGESAFSNCTGLTSLTIPETLRRIEARAFNRCSSLKDIYYGGTEAEWKDLFFLYADVKPTIHYNAKT